MAMMHSISEILKAAAGYLDIRPRPALAIFLAAICFLIAEIALSLFGRGWEWWIYLVPVIVFSGTMFFYQARFREGWRAARRRRRNENIAIEAIDKLDQAESSAILHIYHGGGFCRARNNRVFAELERLHILKRFDPLDQAQRPMWQIPRRISRALRRKFGRPDVTKASGQPPWQTW
jgi:hypothetical protein